PAQRGNQEFDSERNEFANTFILCSLNKTSLPETSLVFDYIEKEFKARIEVDPIINLDKPLTGFLFPVFNDTLQTLIIFYIVLNERTKLIHYLLKVFYNVNRP